MNGDEIVLRSFFDTIRRQVRLLVLMIVLAVAGAGVYLFLAPPIYTAQTLVLIDPSNRSVLEPNNPVVSSRGSEEARIDSEVEILRSDAVALAVVQAEDLLSDPEFGPSPGVRDTIQAALGISPSIEESGRQLLRQVLNRFKDAVSVRRRGLTYIIAISVRSQSPERASELANAMAAVYIRQQVESKIAAAVEAGLVLETQILRARDALEASEGAFTQQISDAMTELSDSELGAAFAASQSRLSAITAARSAAEAQLSSLDEARTTDNWGTLVATLENEALTSLIEQRDRLERRISGLAGDDGTADALQRELDRLEERLAVEVDREFQTIEQRVIELSDTETEAQRDLRRDFLTGDLPADVVAGFFETQQRAENARAQYERLLLRRNELDTEAGIQLADSRVVSPALAPVRPSAPRTTLVMLVALGFGVFSGIGLAFAREYIAGGFTSKEQLQHSLNATTVSAIPLIEDARGTEQSQADRIVSFPTAPYSESFRRIREMINWKLDGTSSEKRARVIQVTSALPREGKTTSALSLARTYALAGEKTLLIDADLRNPSVHKHVGFRPDLGTLDILTDVSAGYTLADITRVDTMSGVDLAAGREKDDGPVDKRVVSDAFLSVLNQAREDYDVIIVDSPPALIVVDCLVLAGHVDLVVMLVRWAATGEREAKEAVTDLKGAMRKDVEIIPVLSQARGLRATDYQYYY